MGTPNPSLYRLEGGIVDGGREKHGLQSINWKKSLGMVVSFMVTTLECQNYRKNEITHDVENKDNSSYQLPLLLSGQKRISPRSRMIVVSVTVVVIKVIYPSLPSRFLPVDFSNLVAEFGFSVIISIIVDASSRVSPQLVSGVIVVDVVLSIVDS